MTPISQVGLRGWYLVLRTEVPLVCPAWRIASNFLAPGSLADFISLSDPFPVMEEYVSLRGIDVPCVLLSPPVSVRMTRGGCITFLVFTWLLFAWVVFFLRKLNIDIASSTIQCDNDSMDWKNQCLFALLAMSVWAVTLDEHAQGGIL